MNDNRLLGARVWLSASGPKAPREADGTWEPMEGLVRLLVRGIFEAGGHVFHGGHPRITHILIEEARRSRARGGRADCLSLAVSQYFASSSLALQIAKWREVCAVYETPAVEGEDSRALSLEVLRKWLAERSDAIVAVGGVWKAGRPGEAGIPQEISLALEQGVPCFLLGGWGGAVREFLRQSPATLSLLKNGLRLGVNAALAVSDDVLWVAEEVLLALSRLPLVRGGVSDGATFRVLALDGGGIRGAFTAAALAAWERDTGHRCVDHFDLVAGTSTGGILAIGLARGLSALQMLEFYRSKGTTIFPVTSLQSRLAHRARHWIVPKYAQRVLLAALKEVLEGQGSTPGAAGAAMRDSLCRLAIPAYKALAGAVHVFRTPHQENFTSDAGLPMVQVALATAAAPTYFSAARLGTEIAETSYVDGGVWANCPALVAIVEALAVLRVPVDRVDVLSVGTTDAPFSALPQARSGIAGWSVKLHRLLLSGQEGSSVQNARSLVGADRFFRVNHTCVPGRYQLDDARRIGELAELGEHEAMKEETRLVVRSRFLNGMKTARWQPLA